MAEVDVHGRGPKCEREQPPRGCGRDLPTITRYGRVIVVASFVAFLLHNGVLCTLGVFIPTLLREFKNGSGQLGWVVSSGVAVECFAGPMGNIVVKRIGCRRAVMLGGALLACGTATASFATSMFHLFACLGVVAGLGGSIVHVAIVVAIGKYYSRHYTVANGIAYAGPGAGVFAFPPLIEYLIENYGWRGSLIIEAAIVSNVMVLGALFRPASRFKSRLRVRRPQSLVSTDKDMKCKYQPVSIHPDDRTNPSRDEEEISDPGTSEDSIESGDSRRGSISKPVISDDHFSLKSLLNLSDGYRRRSLAQFAQSNAPTILAFYLACVFHTAGYSGVSVHIVNQVVSSGLSSREASIVFSCVGIGSFIGRLTHGWFLTRRYVTPSWMYTLSLVVSVAATVALPLTASVGGKMACATAVGICSGVYFSLVAVILRELVGILYLGVAFGVSLFCSGVGTTLGGFVVGLVRDVTGSYDVPSSLICVFFAVATISSLPRPVIQWYRERRRRLMDPLPTPV